MRGPFPKEPVEHVGRSALDAARWKAVWEEEGSPGSRG